MRIRQPIRYTARFILGLFGVVVLLAIYGYLSYRQHLINPRDTTIPNATQLWDGVTMLFTPKDLAFGGNNSNGVVDKISKTMFFRDGWATYSRLFIGLGWGCLFSVILGVLMGCFESLAARLVPVLSFLAKIPGTAMLAVFFVLSGTGENMFIAMIGFGVLPTLTQSVYFAARDDLHHEEIDKAYTLGASNLEVIWEVVFPKIMPKILDSIRLQVGPAMVYLVAAEMLVGQVGVGYQIRMQQRLLHMNVVYVYLAILGLTGLLIDKAMLSFRQWYCPWFDQER